MLDAVFTVAVLLAAGLLFVIEPMVAKMVLPVLGGASSVWIGCMLFFQAALLAGYLYAHLIARGLPPRTQVAVHAVVLALPLAFLPVHVATGGPPTGGPAVLWLLGALLATAGVPFWVVATTGPLLQRWYAEAAGTGKAEPYFLYAASSAGSLAGLLGYPFLIEPSLPLSASHGLTQGRFWAAGYVAFVLLVLACAVLMLKRRSGGSVAPSLPRLADTPPATARQRSLWLALAFVPSSLTLGATQFLTTDIASVPLLWVLPLSLYLLTFVVAFSGKLRLPTVATSWAFAVLAVATAGSLWAFARPSPLLAIPLHLLMLFGAGLVCHGRLAAARPDPARLTEYYLWIALGGCLGGVFNALVAPLVFRSVLEYPVALTLACLLRPAAGGTRSDIGRRRALLLDLALPAALALGLAALHAALQRIPAFGALGKLGIEAATGALICLAMAVRPLRFGLSIAVILAAGWVHLHSAGPTLYSERTFFGVSRVVEVEGQAFEREDPPGGIIRIPLHVLLHGTTRHGSQLQDPKLRYRATSYYHPSGPIGQVFRTFRRTSTLTRVAMIGLGAGTLAVYGEPGQRFTFYELDPAVARIARDERLFTYLRDCRAVADVVLGDGRRSVASAQDGEFGLIVLDAFSSDAIPVHLITREAVRLYFRKLRPDGILAINLTSEWFDLRPVVAAVAADLGLAAIARQDLTVTPRQALEGKDPTSVAVIARSPETLAPLLSEPGWVALSSPGGASPAREFLWTDDASSVLRTLRRPASKVAPAADRPASSAAPLARR